MPWKPADAMRHTRKARTGKLQRMWANVANSALQRGKSEGAAVRMANGVVSKHSEARLHAAATILKGRKRKKKRR